MCGEVCFVEEIAALKHKLLLTNSSSSLSLSFNSSKMGVIPHRTVAKFKGREVYTELHSMPATIKAFNNC